jgi:ATP-dependent Clp protease ATP-binding subunit ClpA
MPDFGQFTEEARQVVVRSQEIAREFGHTEINTGDLLLGIFGDESLAARALARCGITLEDVRVKVIAISNSNSQSPEGRIPFSTEASDVLSQTLREALALGDDRIVKAEHILLALVTLSEGIGGEALARLEFSANKVRLTIMELRSEAAPED